MYVQEKKREIFHVFIQKEKISVTILLSCNLQQRFAYVTISYD